MPGLARALSSTWVLSGATSSGKRGLLDISSDSRLVVSSFLTSAGQAGLGVPLLIAGCLLRAGCLLNTPSGLVIVSSVLDVSAKPDASTGLDVSTGPDVSTGLDVSTGPDVFGTSSSGTVSKVNTGSSISSAERGCRGSDSQSMASSSTSLSGE